MNRADNTACVYYGELNTSYEPLTGFENDYKIKLVDGLAKIKRIEDKYEPKYSLDTSAGYYRVYLNNTPYLLHRIIAEHYIDHNDKFNIVDHIDQHKDNYNIINLRWTTQHENMINRTGLKGIKYEFVDELPDNAVGIVSYGKYFLRNYFYANGVFYYYTGVNYRILPKLLDKNSYYYVQAKDINNKRVIIMLKKWDKIKGF